MTDHIAVFLATDPAAMSLTSDQVTQLTALQVITGQRIYWTEAPADAALQNLIHVIVHPNDDFDDGQSQSTRSKQKIISFMIGIYAPSGQEAQVGAAADQIDLLLFLRQASLPPESPQIKASLVLQNRVLSKGFSNIMGNEIAQTICTLFYSMTFHKLPA